jgi:hypothetical protein
MYGGTESAVVGKERAFFKRDLAFCKDTEHGMIPGRFEGTKRFIRCGALLEEHEEYANKKQERWVWEAFGLPAGVRGQRPWDLNRQN